MKTSKYRRKHTNELATTDTRFPVEVALQYAFEHDLITPEREKKLRAELEKALAGSVEKFTGFKDERSIKNASEITLGALSLALIYFAGGKSDPKTLSKIIVDDGLVKHMSGLIKVISDFAKGRNHPGFPDEIESKEYAPRDLLLLYSTHRHDRTKVWSGYGRMMGEFESSRKDGLTIELARWLIVNVLKMPYQIWLQKSRIIENQLPQPDQVINTLILRYCADYFKGRDVGSMRITNFRDIHRSYKKTKSWSVRARARYDQLVSEIPEELQEVLVHDGQDWFRCHLKDGPLYFDPKKRVIEYSDLMGQEEAAFWIEIYD